MSVSGLSHSCCLCILPSKAACKHSSNSLFSAYCLLPCPSKANFTASLSAFNLTTFETESGLRSSFLIPEFHGTRTKQRCMVRRNKEEDMLVVKATAKTERLEEQKKVSTDSKDAQKEAAKLARRAVDWERAVKLKETGSLYQGKVEACNNGGLLVRFGSLPGFLPFSQMSSSRLPKDGSKTMGDVGKDLIGQTISLKILEVKKEEKRLIFSEKLALWMQSVQQIKEGDIFEGRVNCVTDFGAFVDLRFADGSYPVSGLVHVSELSWDPVRDPREIVQEGQDVRVKVANMDLERMRLGLSIKQLQADPLFETLDTLMPQEDIVDADVIDTEEETSSEPLPGLDDICLELLKEDGITEVTPGRLALEKRVVSQDLELWLSSAPVEDGKLTLLARAGRQVQEVYLQTSLDREGIKAAVQRVTGRVP